MSENNITAWPLQWPAGWKRSKSHERKAGRFSREESYSNQQGSSWRRKKSLTVADAIDRVTTELDRMGIRHGDLIVSTNIPVKLNGLPYSQPTQPQDPGVAVYWRTWRDKQMKCMAIDRYTTVADNIAAIAASIAALRTVERHGGAEILDRAFLGFQAIMPPGSAEWKTILGNPKTREEAESAYRSLALLRHPDKGGSSDEFAKLSNAIRAAREALAGG